MPMQVAWKELGKSYLLSFGNPPANQVLDRHNDSNEVKFSLSGEPFSLKSTVMHRNQAEIIGIYRKSIPYKLFSFRLSDYSTLTISQAMGTEPLLSAV
jgi:hypothetical protein